MAQRQRQVFEGVSNELNEDLDKILSQVIMDLKEKCQAKEAALQSSDNFIKYVKSKSEIL